jgi:hypothetical protein
MIKNIIIVVLVLIVGGLLFIDFTPKASVVAPEVQKTSDYKRPVREGNCWRQFIGTGSTDSILVCH